MGALPKVNLRAGLKTHARYWFDSRRRRPIAMDVGDAGHNSNSCVSKIASCRGPHRPSSAIDSSFDVKSGVLVVE